MGCSPGETHGRAHQRNWCGTARWAPPTQESCDKPLGRRPIASNRCPTGQRSDPETGIDAANLAGTNPAAGTQLSGGRSDAEQRPMRPRHKQHQWRSWPGEDNARLARTCAAGRDDSQERGSFRGGLEIWHRDGGLKYERMCTGTRKESDLGVQVAGGRWRTGARPPERENQTGRTLLGQILSLN